ncbi:type I restriction enzyme HsdR N-terminal domain-containing protein [Ferruginibacter sp. HRS2-29]|uniref:type I restriction enzyme HsdR N-terminal domain-containing protein n=1 Tax=Ferruginibacter sp. HRS2-29 TaxID=2487334 RepID=UPI0020CFC8D2|nr:type I restriction enzyme HsdR N-terminal domain-containing protein [Ferruginibacter sp. HRS2-29]MCP9753187.1 type I restriction enzyme HsdR N-terminal domain-containing protein [Ferruginibacter sp. HRS2-29]
MLKVVYPDTRPSIKTDSGKELIFCIIRKKWLQITPEEWVRQNFLLYLIEVLGYSRSLIAVEKKIRVGELEKRFDIVVYNQQTMPFIVIECKEMNVALSAETLSQVLRYNIKLDAACLVVTNGSFSHAFVKKDGVFYEVKELPVP